MSSVLTSTGQVVLSRFVDQRQFDMSTLALSLLSRHSVVPSWKPAQFNFTAFNENNRVPLCPPCFCLWIKHTEWTDHLHFLSICISAKKKKKHWINNTNKTLQPTDHKALSMSHLYQHVLCNPLIIRVSIPLIPWHYIMQTVLLTLALHWSPWKWLLMRCYSIYHSPVQALTHRIAQQHPCALKPIINSSLCSTRLVCCRGEQRAARARATLTHTAVRVQQCLPLTTARTGKSTSFVLDSAEAEHAGIWKSPKPLCGYGHCIHITLRSSSL